MPQQRRLVLVVAIGLLPLLALVTVFLTRNISEAEAQITRERVTLARAAALVVNAFLADNITALEVLSHDAAAVDDRDPARVSRHLAAIADVNPNWDGVGLVDGRGLNVTVTATTALRSVSVADRDYFRDAMSTGKAAVSQAVIGRFSGRPTVAVAVPVTLGSGDRGVLTGVLSLAYLDRELRALPGVGEIEVIVVDRTGHAVVHPDNAVVSSLADLSGLPGIRAALAGETGSLRRATDGAELLTAHTPVGAAGWGVVVRQPTSAAFALVRSEIGQAVALTALGALLALAIAWVFGGRLQRSYAESELRRRSIERLIEQRAQFLGTVGHELKTPLTSISMAAEMIGRRAGDDPDIRRFVALMRQQVDRATGLIAELLDLSRLESGVPLRRDPVDLGALVRAVAERQQALLPPAPHIDLSVEAADAVVDGDEARLEQVLANVLSNAVKYSPSGGRIEVRLAREGDRAVLTVIDGGIGMTPEERELAFAPFTRGTTARSHGIEGTGLGLHITRTIVDAHRGRIALASTPGSGTTVVIDLPLGSSRPAAAPPARELASEPE